MTDIKEITNGYFAAANGYRGFRSYFAKVFSPAEYSKITVLKGGPGTGKSSFMKKVYSDLTEMGLKGEAILCSSDPNSLDGIIFSSGDVRIAVIDGTAPHERDASLPGAVDKILNLGDGWNEKWLRAQREKIVELNVQKARSYKTAYDYLAISGKCEEFITKTRRAVFDFSKARKFARTFLQGEVGTAKINTRLISAFGKTGEHRLDTLEKKATKIYSISGERKSCDFLMEAIADELSLRREGAILCPSALDEAVVDAIFIESTGVLIGGFENGEKIGAEGFDIKTDALSAEETKRAEEIRTSALNESVRWFKIASDIHFRLEEIYSRAMNFDKIDEMYEKEIVDIKNILFNR